MGKTASSDRSGYQCQECGWRSARWVGRCGECQAWGSVGPLGGTPAGRTTAGPVTSPAVRIHEVAVGAARARSTGVAELDRVLGGGLVPGAVVLVAGEPGVGKSTLLLDVAARCARPDGPALYVTGEESVAQVRMRADRIAAVDPYLFLAAETGLAAVLGHIEQVAPALLVLDSVQSVAAADVDGSPGGVAQVREVAAALIRVAKERGMATLLVGHVTKDGAIAGPRTLEHLVDVVVHFEGDRHARLRLVRAVKNRFGPADEVGCFELRDDGIVGLADPSSLFLSRRPLAVPGTCRTATLEGRRPMVTEVQSLVAPATGAHPRRATSGVDAARVALVLGVLERRVGVRIGPADVYVASVGGVRIAEPATDLAVALALAGGVADHPLPTTLVAVGEVGLSGEVRPVTGLARRLQEAARLGCTDAIVPADDASTGLSGVLRVHPVDTVSEARACALALAGHAAVTAGPSPG